MRHDYIDWCIVDALVYLKYSALIERLEEIKRRFAWTRAGKLRRYDEYEHFYRIYRIGHRAYETLNGPVLNPTHVRDELIAAKKEEVFWPNAVWPILDTVIARNPSVWHVAEPPSL